MLTSTKQDLANPGSNPERMAKLDSYRQFLGLYGAPESKLFNRSTQVLLEEEMRFIEADIQLFLERKECSLSTLF